MSDPIAPDDLVGTRTPGGEYRVAAYERDVLRDTVYAWPSDTPHPVSAFIGAQRGMGVSVSRFFELLGTSVEDGPVLAETTIDLREEMRIDRTYRVDGTVTHVVTKSGATFGRFDLITCEFVLSHVDSVTATVTNVYAVRRGEDT